MFSRLAIVAGVAFISVCTPSRAQGVSSVLSVASPIPGNAAEQFCYYAGLAYSPNSYLPVALPSPTTNQVSSAEATSAFVSGSILTTGRVVILQCVADDGSAECATQDCKARDKMMWAVRSAVTTSPKK